jgi:hypothetical protein
MDLYRVLQVHRDALDQDGSLRFNLEALKALSRPRGKSLFDLGEPPKPRVVAQRRPSRVDAQHRR